MTAQQKKTEVIVARMYDFRADGTSQLVRSIALTQPPSEKLTMHEMVPPRLQALDFEIPESVPISLWKLRMWAEIDYIPLPEFRRDFRLKPEEHNMVIRPDTWPMVIVRYVDYERVKAF